LWRRNGIKTRFAASGANLDKRSAGFVATQGNRRLTLIEQCVGFGGRKRGNFGGD